MNQHVRQAAENEEQVFELIRSLGQGGFAHTWLARVLDAELIQDYGTEQVAIKIPSSPKNQRVLQKEVKNNILLQERLKACKSDNLCRYLGIDLFDNQWVMVMEFVPDGSLRKVVRGFNLGRRKRLEWKEAVLLVEGVLEGLVLIHGEHLFHRDIKPENILLHGRVPKIADLGISKFLTTNQRTCSGSCTIFYAAPELLGKEGSSFPADVWATAVMLYEMLTGQLPFGEDDSHPAVVIDAIRDERQTAARTACPQVPAWLSDLIDLALEKDVARRITARQMLETLRAAGKTPTQLLERVAAVRAAIQKEKDERKVESLIRSLIEEFPEEAQVYQLQGEHFRQCELHSEAVEAFRRGLVLDDRNALLHWDLALEYQRLRRSADAIRHLELARSFGLDPAKASAAERLLKALRAGQRKPVAGCPKTDANQGEFERELARLQDLLQQERGDEAAEKALRDLIRRFPRNPVAYQCLGEYYSRCGLDVAASAAFLEGLAIDKDNALLHWDLALSYQRMGRKPQAIEELRQALALDLNPGLRRHARTLLRALGASGG
ncbi:MAG TPA: protein kinase [Verrucomicrobiota bacterium]|nr:protein kinase [Verrucomicrobiota bacterium]HNU50833.1 protein kinase [Verrucomicrobiota bacterium]